MSKLINSKTKILLLYFFEAFLILETAVAFAYAFFIKETGAYLTASNFSILLSIVILILNLTVIPYLIFTIPDKIEQYKDKETGLV